MRSSHDDASSKIGGAERRDAAEVLAYLSAEARRGDMLARQSQFERSKNLEGDLIQPQLGETPPSLETPDTPLPGALPSERGTGKRRRYRAILQRVRLVLAARVPISSPDTVSMLSTIQEAHGPQRQETFDMPMAADIAYRDPLLLTPALATEGHARSDQSRIITSTAGNAATAGTGDIASAILKYITTIVMTNIFSQTVYGIFIAVLAAAAIVGTVVVFGLDYTLIRFLSIYRARDERGLAAGLLRFVVRTALISGLVSGALFFLSATLLAHLVYHHNAYILPLREVALLVPLIALQPVLAGGLIAMKRIKWKVYTDRLIQPGVSLFLMGIFYLLRLRLEALILATICGYLASIIVGQLLLGRATKNLVRNVVPRFAAKTWLHFALPMTFTSFVQNILNNTDVLFLAAFASAAQVGLYGAADRVSFVVLMPLGAFITVFAPLIAEHHARGEREQLISLAKIVTKWAFTLSWPLFLCFCVFHGAILSIFSREYTAAGLVLIILSLANLIDVGVGPTGDLLLMTGHTRVILANTVAAMTVNIGLSFLLVPRFNVIGAAVASGVALVIPNLAGLVEVYCILKFLTFRRDMLKPALAGGVASVVGLLLQRVIPVGYGFQALLGAFGLVLPFMCVYALVLAFLRFSEEDIVVFDAVRSRFGGKALRVKTGSWFSKN